MEEGSKEIRWYGVMAEPSDVIVEANEWVDESSGDKYRLTVDENGNKLLINLSAVTKCKFV